MTRSPTSSIQRRYTSLVGLTGMGTLVIGYIADDALPPPLTNRNSGDTSLGNVTISSPPSVVQYSDRSGRYVLIKLLMLVLIINYVNQMQIVMLLFNYIRKVNKAVTGTQSVLGNVYSFEMIDSTVLDP